MFYKLVSCVHFVFVLLCFFYNAVLLEVTKSNIVPKQQKSKHNYNNLIRLSERIEVVSFIHVVL